MAKRKQKQADNETTVHDAKLAEPGPANPMAEPGEGGTSAEDVARPRDREAVEGNEKVVPGFTTTGPTGSQGGRSLYGIAPEDEEGA